MSQLAGVSGDKLGANARAWMWGGGAFLLIALLWWTNQTKSNHLLLEVTRFSQFDFLETNYLYALLHVFVLVPVFLLSFDKKVAYYKQWRYLFPAIGIVGVVFIIWDVYFTILGVWGFNESYFASLTFLTLPVEEWLFFVSVPFAVVFIYECLNAYIAKDLLYKAEPFISKVLIVVLLLVGFFSWGQIYTATTFILSGLFLLYHYLFIPNNYRSRFYLAYLVSCLPFMLVNGVLTGGFTESPVVIYNPEEYLGIRLGSVPLDDAVYSFLLMMGVVTFYELFRRRSSTH